MLLNKKKVGIIHKLIINWTLYDINKNLKILFSIFLGKNIKFVRTAKRTEFTNKIALCRIAPKAETLVLRHSLLEFYQSNI